MKLNQWRRRRQLQLSILIFLIVIEKKGLDIIQLQEELIKQKVIYLFFVELKGKWIILQDWSTCTLACGGGTQTRHRYCVFPPSGIPCEGKAIETRSCNTDPCSNITQIEDNLDYLPTQIKILRVSQIPQRYKVN